MARSHTDREYDNQLRAVRENLLLMAGHVESMIAASIQALVHQDRKLAEQTIEVDHKVNLAEVETDELCLLILAKRQPMASDLRFITLALKMVTDLERIGDLAVNICERALQLDELPAAHDLDDIHKMGQIVQTMVKDAIDAFVDADVDKAEAVIARDDQLDELYHKVFKDVLKTMVSEHDAVQRGIHLQSVAKWLERMGDHSTNLAELVVFMVKGKDIRHTGKLDD